MFSPFKLLTHSVLVGEGIAFLLLLASCGDDEDRMTRKTALPPAAIEDYEEGEAGELVQVPPCLGQENR